MSRTEFSDGCNLLKGKKIVIVGCGAQGLNQVQTAHLQHHIAPHGTFAASHNIEYRINTEAVTRNTIIIEP
jgi:hypothetical protein